MDRIVDKGCVAAALAAAVLALGRPDAELGTVLGLLLALSLSAAFELVGAGKRWRVALPILSAVGACLPQLTPWMLPLAAYDLVAAEPRLAALPLVFAAASAVQGAEPAQMMPCLFATLLAEMLSWRSTVGMRREGELHTLRDSLQEQLLDLESSRRELEKARLLEARAATLAERTRISREIHDNVGHLLTRAILQVEALEVIHADEPAVRDDFHAVGQTVHEALDVTRASVHAMADEARDLSTELELLARESDVADLDVRLEVDDEPSAEVTRCFIAIVREALNNAARHARAQRAVVRVVEYPAFWQLSVKNDVASDGGPAPSGGLAAGPGVTPRGGSAAELEKRGMGLRNMRERVEALHGTFRVSCEDGTFTVFATIPRGREA